jgi:hypothetical protein
MGDAFMDTVSDRQTDPMLFFGTALSDRRRHNVAQATDGGSGEDCMWSMGFVNFALSSSNFDINCPSSMTASIDNGK